MFKVGDEVRLTGKRWGLNLIGEKYTVTRIDEAGRMYILLNGSEAWVTEDGPWAAKLVNEAENPEVGDWVSLRGVDDSGLRMSGTLQAVSPRFFEFRGGAEVGRRGVEVEEIKKPVRLNETPGTLYLWRGLSTYALVCIASPGEAWGWPDSRWLAAPNTRVDHCAPSASDMLSGEDVKKIVERYGYEEVVK